MESVLTQMVRKADIFRELKFTPDWLNGSWDWLIYDAVVFLSQNLLPYSNENTWRGEGNGFKCFEHDMDFLLNVVPTKIQRSRDKMIELKGLWRRGLKTKL